MPSLVGSEMCIRDRRAAGLDEWAADNLLAYVGEQKEAVGQVPSDPVSYTHLTLPTIHSVEYPAEASCLLKLYLSVSRLTVLSP
ncbi:hypothetical protein BN3590_03150 [Clostridium sp. C105KSO15]|nr:hypothetical protein BN3590_03150 [Clostridium sp. C105KSO15]